MAVTLAAEAGAAPSPELALLEQARVALSAGDQERATVLARSALRSSRRAGEAPLDRSLPLHREAQDILAACGLGDDLVRRYDRLLRLHSRDPAARYLRARVEPDPERKLQDLDAVLVASDLFWAAYDLAEGYAARGDWPRAARYAEKAVELRPGEAAAWNVLGHLRLEASRFVEGASERKRRAGRAREALAKAVELDPKMAQAHYNLGLVDYALGEADAARDSWREATRLRPDFAEAWNALGHMEARAGRVDESIALYKKALASRAAIPRPGRRRAAAGVGSAGAAQTGGSDRARGVAHNNLAVAYYRRSRATGDGADLARATRHLALAEAAGHVPAESFRRVLVRAVEEAAFADFMKLLGGPVRPRMAVSRDAKPVPLAAADERRLASAIAKMRFRDSGGGVSLGERRAGEAVVARYAEAARVELTLAKGARRSRIVVTRRAPGGSARLAPWVADGGYRFSAHAPELVRLAAARAGFDVPAPKEGSP